MPVRAKNARMSYKQAARKECRSSISGGTSRKTSRTRYKQLAKKLSWRRTDFGPTLGLRDFGSVFGFAWQPTFWLRFLLRSRLVPVTSPENWFRYCRNRLNSSRYTRHPYSEFWRCEPRVGAADSASCCFWLVLLYILYMCIFTYVKSV